MICGICSKCHKDANLSCGVCDRCARSLRSGHDRIVDDLLVRPAFLHDDVIRGLVHRLKYSALVDLPPLVIGAMASRVPPDTSALIPIPRAVARTLRYGVDPALVLAKALSRVTGIPVLPALSVPLLAASQARRGRQRRRDPVLRAVRSVPPGAVIVDDVVTTGRTLGAARHALGHAASLAVTLTTSVRR